MGRSIVETRNPDTQISATASNANAVVYTVPSGRRFRGYCSNQFASETGSNYYTALVFNSVVVKHRSGPMAENKTEFTMNSVEVTLLAGASVKVDGQGNHTYVWGVESDA